MILIMSISTSNEEPVELILLLCILPAIAFLHAHPETRKERALLHLRYAAISPSKTSFASAVISRPVSAVTSLHHKHRSEA